jgi:ferric-dicitrate binding protein FerR (iron transport regulator)
MSERQSGPAHPSPLRMRRRGFGHWATIAAVLVVLGGLLYWAAPLMHDKAVGEVHQAQRMH